MPGRRRPPKHVREATRAARANGEEPPAITRPKLADAKPPKIKLTSDTQLSNQISKAQMQAEYKLTGFSFDECEARPTLNLGISPDILVGRWSDAAGNTVEVYPSDEFSTKFHVRLERKTGPDIILSLRALPGGQGWYCGSARLHESRSTLTRLMWQFPNGTCSVWVRTLQREGHFDPYGAHYTEYYDNQVYLRDYGNTLDGLDCAPGLTCENHGNLEWVPDAPGVWLSDQNIWGDSLKLDQDATNLLHGAGAMTHAENTDANDQINDAEASIVDALDKRSEVAESQQDIGALEDVDFEVCEGGQQEVSTDITEDQQGNQDTALDPSAPEWDPSAPAWEPSSTASSSSHRPQDNAYVMPVMLTPVLNLHNSLLTSPMCYVVMSKASPKSWARPQPSLASDAARSSDDVGALCGRSTYQTGEDEGTGEQLHDYAQGDAGDYADSIFGHSLASDGGEDDYDHCDYSFDADQGEAESKDGAASEHGVAKSEVSAHSRDSCPW